MKLKLTSAACAVLSLASAQAALITINSGIAPQPANSGDGTIELWLDNGVAAYNASNEPDLPSSGSQVFRVNTLGESPDTPPPAYSFFPTFPDDTLSIAIPTGYFEYVAFHWGGPGGGTYQSYYIGEIGGPNPSEITFNAPGRNGLSWYSVFLPTTPPPSVPDAGSTAGMLGLASLGLIALRRKLSRP